MSFGIGFTERDVPFLAVWFAIGFVVYALLWIISAKRDAFWHPFLLLIAPLWPLALIMCIWAIISRKLEGLPWRGTG